ncbi:uncharacterized protein LOC119765956 [Culex quinquefasciatus]|uniref:uncharacterized protein LOC119765956 n=1 Tax=Culex quinquefasciatus TaxID=7176 RepID=UPI0018E2F594|nr:uncharacterized protein LOC119765956 [Culex quinquefasciatus]
MAHLTNFGKRSRKHSGKGIHRPILKYDSNSEESDYEQKRRLYRNHASNNNCSHTILLVVAVIAIGFAFYFVGNSLLAVLHNQPMQVMSTFETVDKPEIIVDPRTVVNHLFDRVSEYIKLGAQLQYISIMTKAPRDKIVSPGCTSPGEGMVQLVCVHLNEEVEQDITEMFDNFLNVFLSQAQKIPSFVKFEIGQKFNEVQSGLLQTLAAIDFTRENIDFEDISRIKSIKNAFLEAIDSEMQACRNRLEKMSGDSYNKRSKAILETELQVLATTFHEMTKLSESDLFSKAREAVPFAPGLTVFGIVLIVIKWIFILFGVACAISLSHFEWPAAAMTSVDAESNTNAAASRKRV